nr:UDP-3-O-(3-hydroxymyristoyl)glucosamine N-acyltransferase [Acinetobacter qingfengensis]
MSFNLADICRHVQGTVHGDTEFIVEQLKSLEQAGVQDISFVNGEKYLDQAKASRAGVLIVSSDLVDQLKDQCIVLEVKSPYLAFAILTHLFAKPPYNQQGIANTAKIHPTATIGQNVTIGDFVVIGEDTQIGDNSIIHPSVFIADHVKIGHSAYIESHVTISEGTEIGDYVRIHANTSIGGEGFGFAPYQEQWHRIAQLGKVRIGNKVRIGSNCSIDRGALDDTVIDDGVIIDNLVQVAHNVQIGSHTAIAAKTGIAGSTKIGAHCIIGGACGIAGHLEITDHVHLTGMSMVTKSIDKSGLYSSGTGLFDNLNWRKAVIGFRQLTETPINKLVKQLNLLQNRIEKLELEKHTDTKD